MWEIRDALRVEIAQMLNEGKKAEHKSNPRAQAQWAKQLDMFLVMISNEDADLPSCADDYTYRVNIEADGSIHIVCFGLPTVDSNCEGHYDKADDLPNWVQDRLAILMMTPNVKPTPDIRGVGRRISGSVFWIYAPDHTPEEDARA